MYSGIDKILAGEFNQNMHSLAFSTPKIELSLCPGERYEGKFEVSEPEHLMTEGIITSNRIRMKCLTEAFAGSEEQILYTFDASDMEAGECVKGEFYIITNRGEYVIPFEVSIVAPVLNSSLGEIKNVFHFTNLARANWEEAVKLFYTKEFEQIFKGTDRQYFALYRGLSANKGNQQNVEEFLLEIKKKQQVEFFLEDKEIRINEPKENMEYKVVINRNGWGYSTLEVSAEGDFIVLEKTVIRDEDFLGNCFRLSFYIAEEKLHAGKNFGVITLSNAYVSLTVDVVAYCQPLRAKVPGVRLHKKHLTMELMQYYEGFRSKKISASSWMQETEKILDCLAEIDNKDLNTKLFQAQLLITQERYNEAKWLLREVDVLLEDEFEPARYCYYLYLTTLVDDGAQYIEEVTGQVERIFAQNSDNWRIAWLLMHLSEEYTKSPSRKWMVLEEQFKKGSFSPVLYLEAYNLLITNPMLLMHLNEFEQQVLTYAAKKELLTTSIVQQIVFLSAGEKGYSERIFFLLKKCYDIIPGDETLQVICTYLIKGNITGREQFKWYALGIESKLRITRLYEYYMMSCDLSDNMEIPKIVLMYFAFESNLDSVRSSFLYAYVYKKREEFPEIYESYRGQIEHFVVSQALKGRNNKWLAVLYRNIFTQNMMNEEIAKGLATALFIHRLSVKRDDIRKIILVYEKERCERIVQAPGKEMYLPIYGSNVKLLLEDSSGNRYCREEDYRLERLMFPDKPAQMIIPYVTEEEGFSLWLCEKGKSLAAVNEENVDRMKKLADSDLYSESIQKEIRMRLIRYYYDNDDVRKLDAFLTRLEPNLIPNADFAQVVRFLIIRGMCEKAYEWIAQRGAQGIEDKIIMRLCSQLIAIEPYRRETVLTQLAFIAFSAGKYDENILKYLVANHQSTLQEMRNIWKAARAFGIETYAISSRILVQMLYTGAYVGEKTEVFKDYVSGGAKSEIEMAYLSQNCFEYFVNEQLTDDFIMQDLRRVIERQEEIPIVCKLAYTKFYAENAKLIDESISKHIIAFLREILSENMYFAYFKEYADCIGFMRQFADKTMIQYKLEEGSSAILHYLVEKDGEDEGEYVQEEMKNMFCGICVKQFVLFFGEKVQYYITEVCGDKEQLTQSGTLNRSDTDREQKESKYSLINDIATGRMLNDDSTMADLLREYYEQEFTVEELFSIRENR